MTNPRFYPDNGLTTNRDKSDRLIELLDGDAGEQNIDRIERWEPPEKQQTGWAIYIANGDTGD